MDVLEPISEQWTGGANVIQRVVRHLTADLSLYDTSHAASVSPKQTLFWLLFDFSEPIDMLIDRLKQIYSD